MMHTYGEARDWIEGLVQFGIRPGLERITIMLERCGNPQRRLKFIHVAGTNGKGSVCAYLTQSLRSAGYDVGTYTSPYITKFTNRFQLNGEDIPEATLLDLANKLKPLVDELAADADLGSPSMFEVSTALAILYYGTVAYPDFVVWETGLGGRLDVTNVVTPILSIITNVGHDHMDVLGGTLTAIATEKAGIIKNGVPVVTAVTQPEVQRIVQETAAMKRSTLYQLGEHFALKGTNDAFDVHTPFRSLHQLGINMLGAHQVVNATVAVMALEVLRQYYAVQIEDETLREALLATRWAGRLEQVSTQPLLLIDGAHNPEGAEALAATLRGAAYANRPLHLMLGMLANKSHLETLRPLVPLASSIVVTEPDFRKAMPAQHLAEMVRSLATEQQLRAITVEPDWRLALQRWRAAVGSDDIGVVTGTLYLIADVRAVLVDAAEKSDKGW